jgi:hypothetical protein
MSTATTQHEPRHIEVQSAHGAGLVEIQIFKTSRVHITAPNMHVNGYVSSFYLKIMARGEPLPGYFAFIGFDGDISLMVMLEPEAAEAVHAAIPEIKFVDERVEVQS